MSDFKVGDRVKATLGENVLVGEVSTRGNEPGWIWLSPHGATVPAAIFLRDGWHIEKVSPPLPTKVGAIVRRADGELFVRDAANSKFHWVSLGGLADASVDSEASYGGFESIFEGVDES